MNVRGLRRALLGAAALVAVASTASAAPVVTVTIDSVGVYDNYTQIVDTTPNGDGTFGGAGIGYGASFTCDWSLSVNPDPSITGTFSLTNTTSVSKQFVLTVTLPIAVTGGGPGGTKIGGYLGDVTYNDANLDAQLSLDAFGGNPMYRALVDGVGVQDLNVLAGPTFGGPGISVVSNRVTFGGPPYPNAPGPAIATSNIQIRLGIELSAGDHATLPVFFQIEAPEPGSVLLLGVALAGLAVLRKRSA
jgi:PEP-CTERM motif-containing protein